MSELAIIPPPAVPASGTDRPLASLHDAASTRTAIEVERLRTPPARADVPGPPEPGA